MINRVITLTLLAAMTTGISQASDLDDGIGIDEPINDVLEKDVNRTFIVNSAKAKARAGRNSGRVVTDGGLGNISIGVGSDLRGATIINVSNNEDATALAE